MAQPFDQLKNEVRFYPTNDLVVNYRFQSFSDGIYYYSGGKFVAGEYYKATSRKLSIVNVPKNVKKIRVLAQVGSYLQVDGSERPLEPRMYFMSQKNNWTVWIDDLMFRSIVVTNLFNLQVIYNDGKMDIYQLNINDSENYLESTYSETLTEKIDKADSESVLEYVLDIIKVSRTKRFAFNDYAMNHLVKNDYLGEFFHALSLDILQNREMYRIEGNESALFTQAKFYAELMDQAIKSEEGLFVVSQFLKSLLLLLDRRVEGAPTPYVEVALKHSIKGREIALSAARLLALEKHKWRPGMFSALKKEYFQKMRDKNADLLEDFKKEFQRWLPESNN